MIAGTVSEQYRCLVEILTCLVCKEMVTQAHLCPNCSKFYCLNCIDRQLGIEEKCLNCNRHLNRQMLTNCEQLCGDLTETLQRVKLRGFESRRGHDKSPYYCYRHKLQKTYYCQSCHKPLCSDCSVLTEAHRGHEFIKLSLMKSQFKQKISHKLDEISSYIHNLDRKINALNEESGSSQQIEHESLAKVQSNMKSLKDQLKKRLKNIMKAGQKKLDLYNEAIERWNDCYEKEITTLKSTSKGKFVEKEYNRLEQKLLAMLEEANCLESDINLTKEETSLNNVTIDYINPEYYTYIFILEKFNLKRQSNGFFYTETVTTQEGLQLRLKIYPQGISEEVENHKNDLKMIKRHSKNQDYLAIFIQLVDGPVTNTKQKHQLILNSQHRDGRPFVREFQSEFDVGLCWGYEHFIKLNQLYDQGYYNSDLDFVEVTLKIAPCSYYQAAKDQLQLMKVKEGILQAKQQRLEQLELLMSQKQIRSTWSCIEEEVSN